jgi:hypothetical protein
MFFSLVHVAFPNPNDSVSAFLEIRILGFVEPYSVLLFFIWLWKAFLVTMPVVAVELNHKTESRHESVDTEFVCDQILFLVRFFEFVEHGVAYLLKFGRFHRLLLYSHFKKSFNCCRIFVSACDRAIGDFVVTGGGSRWRPAERLIAHLTGMIGLVPSLPHISTCQGAESRGRRSTFGDDKRFSADLTFDGDTEPCSIYEPAGSRAARPVSTPHSRFVPLSADLTLFLWKSGSNTLACHATELSAATTGLGVECFSAHLAVICGACLFPRSRSAGFVKTVSGAVLLHHSTVISGGKSFSAGRAFHEYAHDRSVAHL